MHHVVIVARDRPDLYADLTRRFDGDPTLQVLYDRRLRDRRQGRRTYRYERRENDRRHSVEDMEAKLWTAGYAIVRVE